MSKTQDFKDAGYSAFWVIVTTLFVLAIVVGIWWFRVGTSDVKGRGDSTIIKNSAQNRIKAQEEYVSLLNEVKRADQQLTILAATRGNSNNAETRYVGGVSYCLSATADYNKLAEKYRSADFIPAGYPFAINQADPATDCKEN